MRTIARAAIIAIVLWAVLITYYAGLVWANINFLGAMIGPGTGYYVMVLMMIPGALVLAWAFARLTRGEHWLLVAVLCGVGWVVASTLFHIGFSMYEMGSSWRAVSRDYQFWNGQLWPYVLFVQLIAPTGFAVLVSRRRSTAAA